LTDRSADVLRDLAQVAADLGPALGLPSAVEVNRNGGRVHGVAQVVDGTDPWSAAWRLMQS
jgi:hypothetical protein